VYQWAKAADVPNIDKHTEHCTLSTLRFNSAFRSKPLQPYNRLNQQYNQLTTLMA